MDEAMSEPFHLAQFEPRQSASRYIADALRVAIVEGSLRPGEPLRQDAIARQFSVSAIPVREAFRQLESEGWVSIEPNRVWCRVAMESSAMLNDGRRRELRSASRRETQPWPCASSPFRRAAGPALLFRGRGARRVA